MPLILLPSGPLLCPTALCFLQGKAKGKGKDNFDLALEDEFPALDPQVATILSVEPHPNADKLKICSVETASGSFKVLPASSLTLLLSCERQLEGQVLDFHRQSNLPVSGSPLTKRPNV